MVALIEAGTRLAITVATALAVLVIAVFYDVALDLAGAAWEYAVGLAVATGLAVGALAVIHRGMTATVGRTAVGWWGMVAGRVPAGFGPGDRNAARAAGDVLAFAIATPAGLALAARGARDGQHGWSTAGLMLVAAGVVFGLIAAVPRLYFAHRQRGRRRDDGRRDDAAPEVAKRGRRRGRGRGTRDGAPGASPADRADDVAVLVTAALLGIALSMCTASTLARWRERHGPRELARGDWLEGCAAVEPGADACPAAVDITLVPRRARLLRVEAVTTCALSVATADGRAVVTPDEAAMRAAAERPPREITTQAFRLDASDGARYVLTLRPPPGAPACRFSVRYREAAP